MINFCSLLQWYHCLLYTFIALCCRIMQFTTVSWLIFAFSCRIMQLTMDSWQPTIWLRRPFASRNWARDRLVFTLVELKTNLAAQNENSWSTFYETFYAQNQQKILTMKNYQRAVHKSRNISLCQRIRVKQWGVIEGMEGVKYHPLHSLWMRKGLSWYKV